MDSVVNLLYILAPIIIIILAILLVVKATGAALKLSIIIAAFLLIATIFFGDGHSIVSKVSTIFTNGDKIVSIYDKFKEKEAENPILDQQIVKDSQDKVEDFLKDAKDKASEKTEEFTENLNNTIQKQTEEAKNAGE